jgi:DNA-binding transcriptional ArsR family regulator
MLDAVAQQFRALAEPTRLRLLQALRAGPRSVSELAAATGLSHANASKHLLVLAAAGFLARREDGTRTLYALADASTDTLCTLMCDRVTQQAKAGLRTLKAR